MSSLIYRFLHGLCRICLAGLLLFLFLSGHGRVVAGESPCPPEALALGMSTALTGPAADLGINMRDGVLAALDEANRGQGIKGRQLCLAALDDGYEPAQTVPNMLTLINAQQVLALIGNVGTPTAVAALPIALRANTPFYGAFTGAGILRKSPPDRYVINYRASYGEETAAMVDALIEHGGLRPEEIAFFTQRDAFGDAGFVGGLTALKQHGLRQENKIAHGRYERNTLAVENGLADIMLAETVPRAVIMVGTYAPCAEFIQLAKKYGLDALFLNVSFVGAAPLAKGLGDQGDGVIITQVVPHFEADLPIVRDFRKALETWNQDITPSFGALEGYIATRILLLALHRIDDAITRESIIDALEGLGEFDVGLQAPLLLSKEEHQASHQVWPTVIRQGKVVPFAWQNLKGRR